MSQLPSNADLLGIDLVTSIECEVEKLLTSLMMIWLKNYFTQRLGVNVNDITYDMSRSCFRIVVQIHRLQISIVLVSQVEYPVDDTKARYYSIQITDIDTDTVCTEIYCDKFGKLAEDVIDGVLEAVKDSELISGISDIQSSLP